MTIIVTKTQVDWNIFQVHNKEIKNASEFEIYTPSILEEVLEQVATDIKYADLERDKEGHPT